MLSSATRFLNWGDNAMVLLPLAATSADVDPLYPTVMSFVVPEVSEQSIANV